MNRWHAFSYEWFGTKTRFARGKSQLFIHELLRELLINFLSLSCLNLNLSTINLSTLFLSYKLLFLGHRNLIKKITQTAVINIKMRLNTMFITAVCVIFLLYF